MVILFIIHCNKNMNLRSSNIPLNNKNIFSFLRAVTGTKMITTILNDLKNKKSSNLGKTTNSKNCLFTHTSDYLANVLNMRIIVAIEGKAGQRQNYGNVKIATFFLKCFQSCFIPLILPCLMPSHLAKAYAGLIPIS